MQFGTKAETIHNLRGKLKNASVLPEIYFEVREWLHEPDRCYQQCVNMWKDIKVIVRSSAINEDTQEESSAGKFESVADIALCNRQAFNDAVNVVIKSYRDDNKDNQVLVQPMLLNVEICGVAFTVDPNSLGHYYVINYDESGSTSAITSGNGYADKLLYIFKGTNIQIEPDYLNRLCMVLKELEELLGQENLDVEFAVTDNGQIYIFQVRPLCVNGQMIDYQSQYSALKRIESKIKLEACSKPYLCGVRNIYGVMPDWNPAEMIGIRPKALALSLYREMITDSVWAYQRDNYGYRNLRSFPLMVDFCGLPYIDVRVSFNSFVPAELDEAISEKLVNYYLERLAEEPAKHDKVEFDIVFSCYTLDLPERIQVLEDYGFMQDEIQAIIDALRNVTNKIINPETGLWRKDYEKIGILENRYCAITESSMDELEKIYWLMEDCKRYGTLPFAGLARGAFIAVQLLGSMVKKGILTKEDYQNFMNDVNTVSSNMNRDFETMTRKEFLKKYGHLRPGTYDINSLRYDEAPDLYFDWSDRADDGWEGDNQKGMLKKFSLSIDQMHHLKDILEESRLHNDILGLMDFIKTVIEGREYGKFIFTRSLSKVIQMIGDLGEKYGLSREDCAYLDIQDVKGLYSSSQDISRVLTRSIAEGKEKHRLAKALVLPPVLINADEIWSFYYPDAEPNFITMKRTEGETAVLDDNMDQADITDKIVLIACADPGYDWIFSHHIRGFVTMYGGANSHMAIRAGEIGIPAVIGVGEKRYERYRKARSLEIDAMTKTVRIL
ncbi:PEP/pyruvate-binding domain-containing protein [Acetatifactor muris]|uniref:PEP/pyruvate-binding domain-containing protein n=1 Tax=Acetatifactor muris TaxID=879566 RepID=UPI0023F2B4A1|nr:PEP/pyruvate-binding domain-containing protein [Acetatifactor muris]